MNIFCKAAIALAVALPVCGSAAEKVIFKETFDSPDALKKWHKVEYPNGSTFTVENGVLSVNHKHLPGKGSYIEIPVPLIKNGRIDFDVTIDPERLNPSGRIGLYLDLYNISTFWHDSCRDWRMYFSEPNAKRLPHFDIEPVGHKRIAVAKKYVKVHYSIVFDEEKDLVEFYMGDGKNPQSARYDVSVFGHAYYRGGFLRIGSYSYTSDPYRTLIDNVVITEITPEEKEIERKEVLLFDGIGSDHYKVNLILKDSKPNRFFWTSTGANSRAGENNYAYAGMPSVQSVENAKLIVFNDAPNVHPALQRRIAKSVNEGADLLILGGLFTLNKGDFQDSVLAGILPVKLGAMWELSGSGKEPLTLSAKAPFNWDAKDSVMYYYYNYPLTEDAKVLMTASESGFFGEKNIPVLVSKKFGKGTVYVLTGMSAGPNKKDTFYNAGFTEALLKFIEQERSAAK